MSLQVDLDADGFPTGARAESRLEVPAARVWAAVIDLDGYPGRVPMISRVRREGEHVTIQLKFKIALFSVHFEFTARVRKEEGRRLELTWVAGEPRDIVLRFDIEPLDDGRACQLRAEGQLDPTSLGWLAKYFLRHHPEIRFGIVPGVALALFDSVRRATS
jgi:ribosome-associated toxin RatA of RatAB toxin-antitoxin module